MCARLTRGSHDLVVSVFTFLFPVGGDYARRQALLIDYLSRGYIFGMPPPVYGKVGWVGSPEWEVELRSSFDGDHLL